MKKKTIVISLITLLLLIGSTFGYLYIRPYYYYLTAYNIYSDWPADTPADIEYLQKAVDSAVFKGEKARLMSYSMPSLELEQQYHTIIEYYKEIYEINDPSLYIKHNSLVKAYAKTGQFDKALKITSKMKPNRRLLIYTYLEMKDYDKAEKILNEILQEHPRRPMEEKLNQHSETITKLAMGKGQWQKALKYANISLDKTKDSTLRFFLYRRIELLGYRADIYKHLNKPDEMNKDLKEIKELKIKTKEKNPNRKNLIELFSDILFPITGL